MAATHVFGSQWGDEGKGKIIDYLSQTSDFVVRYHGGNNAGHTVINHIGTFALHLIPSGIFHKKTLACISNGTVIDIEVLLHEIDILKKAGIDVGEKLFISPRCHIIMPYHKILDRLYESAKGQQKTGTTGRGIGPVYADKVSYNGIRISDLFDIKTFSQKLEIQLRVKNQIISSFGERRLKQEDIEKTFALLRRKIKPFIKEPYPILQKALSENKKILLEGAQGMFLDNDWGTYPFVTGSNVVSGAANAGAGIAPKHITTIIGVTKAYTTRVGEGPFPTELLDKTGERLRIQGGEFGTTTGRPRRCGWFDATLIRFAAEINGITSLAMTKLDVLDGFSEVKMCIGYIANGEKVQYFDGDTNFFSKVKPIYKVMKGWSSPTKGLTKFADLPKEAKAYLKEIEKQTGVPITLISTGQKRNEIIAVR
jgi:adenylosuccinate synthase